MQNPGNRASLGLREEPLILSYNRYPVASFGLPAAKGPYHRYQQAEGITLAPSLGHLPPQNCLRRKP